MRDAQATAPRAQGPARALAGLLALLGLAGGCAGTPRGDPDQAVEASARSLAAVVDAAGRPLGVAVVARVVGDAAAVLVALPAGRALTDAAALVFPDGARRELLLGADGPAGAPAGAGRAGARVAWALVPARGLDLRPLGLGAPPADGEPVWVVSPGPGLAAAAGAVGHDEGREGGRVVVRASAGEGAAAAVLALDGALLGFLDGGARGEAALLGPGPLSPVFERILVVPGAERLEPDDGLLALALAARAAGPAPVLPGEVGDADLVLELSVSERVVARLSVASHDADRAPGQVVRVPRLGPVTARLVERDVTLGQGETSRPLAPPVLLDRLTTGPVWFALDPAPGPGGPAPGAGAPAGRLVVHLAVAPLALDDARSGVDRSPLGAAAGARAAGDVLAGTLDVRGGDASDVWAVDVRPPAAPGPAPGVLLLARHDRRRALDVALFPPGFQRRLGTLTLPGTRRVAAARVDAPSGRAFLRLRELEGPGDPGAYAAALVGSTEAVPLVRAALACVARAAPGEAPPAWVGGAELAGELALALTVEAGLEPGDVTSALLGELGRHEGALRHLVLRLLEAHFPAAPGALVAVRLEAGATRARRLDAGLLLALRDPDGPFTEPVVDEATSDEEPDVLFKLRVVEAVCRVEVAPVRAALRARLEASDPTGLVARTADRLD